jgi:hypothetical protein
MPLTRMPICSSERWRRPVFAWIVLTSRVCPRSEPPMNSSTSAIRKNRTVSRIESQIACSIRNEAKAT